MLITTGPEHICLSTSSLDMNNDETIAWWRYFHPVNKFASEGPNMPETFTHIPFHITWWSRETLLYSLQSCVAHSHPHCIKPALRNCTHIHGHQTILQQILSPLQPQGPRYKSLFPWSGAIQQLRGVRIVHQENCQISREELPPLVVTVFVISVVAVHVDMSGEHRMSSSCSQLVRTGNKYLYCINRGWFSSHHF